MIWFDVTDILAWGRPPVGIIRTQVEIGNRLLEAYGSELGLCAYGNHGFIKVRASDYRAKLRLLEDMVEPPPRKSAVAYKTIQSAYGFLLNHGPSLLSLPLKAIVRNAKKMSRRPVLPVQEICDLLSGDVYVSMGGDWSVSGKMALLIALKDRGVHTVLCCYDVIPVKLPNFYGAEVRDRFRGYLQAILRAGETIFCISESTKRDLQSFAALNGGSKAKLHTFYLGSSYAFVEAKPLKLPRRDFILFVSTIERRKNHETLYQAYVTIHERHLGTPPLCVCVGMKTPRASGVLADMQTDPRVKDEFLVLGNASDATVNWLYNHCAFTVFPSLYEGWGLPVAESLQHGKFVLAAGNSSLPEAGEHYADYLDAWDVGHWAQEIMRYTTDRELLQAREKRIKDEFRPKTWEAATHSIMSEVKLIQGRHKKIDAGEPSG